MTTTTTKTRATLPDIALALSIGTGYAALLVYWLSR